ncbi:MAG: hypothetical protein WBK91_10375 [Alphaproteobacteria bacterium]
MHVQKKGLVMVERARGWQLDRRVSAGLVIALLAQAGSIVWWASGKEQQDRFQDARLAQGEMLLSRVEAAQQLVAERLARLETRLESQTELLRKIDNRMERK